MPISIQKVSTDLYIAQLSIPMPDVKAAWPTGEPLSADDLLELADRGAHQVDIEDALSVADRNWSDD